MNDRTSQYSRPSEMMMPVTDEHAARLIEIEAFRQITDNLKRLNDNVSDLGKMVHSMDSRLIRIEANNINAEVAELKRDVAQLKTERDKRVGAANLIDWAFKNWPGVFAFLALIFVLLQTSGRLK